MFKIIILTSALITTIFSASEVCAQTIRDHEVCTQVKTARNDAQDSDDWTELIRLVEVDVQKCWWRVTPKYLSYSNNLKGVSYYKLGNLIYQSRCLKTA